jgi:hypothetical protein
MKQQSITTLPPSPEAERRSRMIKYTIAMSIRVACIFAMLFAQGWWLAVFAAGAIFLPYVAVVLANVSGPSRTSEVLRPGGLVPTGPQVPGPDADPVAEPGAPSPSTSEAPASEAPESDDGPAHQSSADDSPAGETDEPPHDERGAA